MMTKRWSGASGQARAVVCRHRKRRRVRARDGLIVVVHLPNQFSGEFRVPRIFAVWQMIRAAQPIRFAVQKQFVAARFKRAKAHVLPEFIENFSVRRFERNFQTV